MSFETHPGDAPPLCRFCGKPIAKHTKTIYFGSSRESRGLSDELTARPKSLIEAQAYTNLKIVSNTWRLDYTKAPAKRDFVDKVSVWDGLSYRDPYFCSNGCSINFGVSAAREGFETRAYRNARSAQTQKVTA